MRRISTATKVVDKFGAGRHGFTDGNAAGGIWPTDLEAGWFDHVQEEIAGVVEAAGIALDPANRTQLLAALRSAGVFQSPAQFNSSTRPATTEFLKAAGFQYASVRSRNATGSLTAADAGALIYLDNSSAFTLTLPAANSLPSGTTFSFKSINSGTHTIQRGGTDSIFPANSPLTSLLVRPGQNLTLTSNGSSTWYAEGSAAFPYDAGFASLLSTPGYQKLPGGLILQCGSATITSGGGQSVGFPIAFPTFSVAATCSAHSAGYIVSAHRPTNVGITVYVYDYNGVPSSSNIDWMAIGY
ncbi:gp53-like domain-containing protein [Noviherbaspirillum cavernae]|uniref:gp53-like domain-containing protein n=1 Tax=Noviherbaspirillum cavernae TaxID=2320862 RepID=UPI0018F2DCB6|nr:hypothetical protein [Noviherbaspirillum cavernae]